MTTVDPAPTPAPVPAPTPGPADQPSAAAYRDTDLVYVDPDSKTVIGPLEWSKTGNPKAKPFVQPPADKDGKERRSGRKNYPWGTYKSMKGAFKLEGKKKHEANKTLDEILEKALKEPFWD